MTTLFQAELMMNPAKIKGIYKATQRCWKGEFRQITHRRWWQEREPTFADVWAKMGTQNIVDYLEQAVGLDYDTFDSKLARILTENWND